MTTDLVKQLRQLSAENPGPRDCIDDAADELERLCAENGALKREAWTWSKACETATARLEPARVDAARYRFLRSGKLTLDMARRILNDAPFGIDSSVDAAMLKTPNA